MPNDETTPQPAPSTSETPAGQPAVPAVLDTSNDWRTAIPEDLKAEPFFAETLANKDLSSALRIAHEGHKEVGRRIPADKAFQIPTDANSPEWERLASAVRPEQPDKYTFQPAPELELDAAQQDNLKRHFWDLGLTDKQAQSHMAYLAESLKTDAEATKTADEAARRADETALRTAFGNDYEAKMEQANRVLSEFGALDYAKEIGIDTDPKLVPMFAALGALTTEGRLHTTNGSGGGATAGQTPEALQQQIDAIRKSKEYQDGWNADLGKQIGELTLRREQAKEKAARVAAGFPG